MRHWFPEFPREPKDVDIAVLDTYDMRRSAVLDLNNPIEYLENPVLLEWFGEQEEYCPAEGLLTLKASHLFWDIAWDKHLFDVQWLLGKGYTIDRELFHLLYNYWNEYHSWNRRSDLKMSATDFFNNAVDCPYSHDELHILLNPEPTYTKVLIGEVEVGEDKFNRLPFEQKCNLVYEEVYVMATERWPEMDYRKAYSIMLKKFIISHAPLWEAIFIIENYRLLHKPTYNYMKVIKEGMKYLTPKNQKSLLV